jgi:hypothetical protein
MAEAAGSLNITRRVVHTGLNSGIMSFMLSILMSKLRDPAADHRLEPLLSFSGPANRENGCEK